MRVVIGHEAFSLRSSRGIARYYTSLHRELRGLGVDSRLVTGLHDNELVRREPKMYGLRVPILSSRLLRAMNRVVAPPLERALVAREGPTFAHCSYFFRPPPNRATALAVTVHDLIPLRQPEFAPFAERFRAGLSDSCAHADVIFAVSEYTRSCLIDELRLDPASIVVTPHGSSLTSSAASVRTGRGESLLHIGARTPRYKNFATLVEASARSVLARAGRLVLFGGGRLDRSERELLGSRGLLDRTDVIPRGSDADLAKALAEAAVVVVPSLEEGFGLPVLEAMAAACPVIASNRGALPETAGGAALLVDPTEPDSLAAAIDAVLGDGALRDRLIAAGLERARLLTWRRTAQLTLAGYRRALGAPPG